jgi:large repetitive protein
LVAVSKPTSGTVKIVGSSVTFVPQKSFTGVASFNYTIRDGNAASASATVSVAVTK